MELTYEGRRDRVSFSRHFTKTNVRAQVGNSSVLQDCWSLTTIRHC